MHISLARPSFLRSWGVLRLVHMSTRLTSSNYGKLVAAVLATLYFGRCILTATDWHFIDNVNLLIHEAGHAIFFFFGEFLYILGGSLFQVLFPLVFVGYFVWKQQFFSASLVLFWIGENLLNVSVYAGDAIVMQLPLLGGDTNGHDWHNILSMLHALQFTSVVSGTIYAAGIIVIVLAAAGSLYFAQLSEQE